MLNRFKLFQLFAFLFTDHYTEPSLAPKEIVCAKNCAVLCICFKFLFLELKNIIHLFLDYTHYFSTKWVNIYLFIFYLIWFIIYAILFYYFSLFVFMMMYDFPIICKCCLFYLFIYLEIELDTKFTLRMNHMLYLFYLWMRNIIE